VTATGLLDSHEQALARQVMIHSADVRTFLWGGYEGAERRMLVCVPAEIPMTDEEAYEGLLEVLRVKKPAISRELTHRDYLGSLTGLGLEREMIGDILTTENGADVIILEDIEDFLLLNYSKAGRTSLQLEALPLTELHIPEQRTVMIKDTVASLRLDNVISSAFSLSRAKAAEAIRSGLVFVNSIQSEKPDMQVDEGCKLVLRGKGKAYLREVGGRTRKDRIFVAIEKFV
jgi:RNA-binding protein YlmH